MSDADAYRLPKDVLPLRYDLRLTPDLDTFTFDGQAAIDIEVSKPTSQIKINAAELSISQVEVETADGSRIPATRIDIDEDSETALFTFGKEVGAGRATLHATFTGALNDQLRGFYRSQYEGPDGKPRFLATTQFEATDARRAFPCWDEPAVKATYQVTLVVPESLTAISNMPIESETDVGSGKKAVRFAESPKMSTYLLAFVIGDMASVEAPGPNGTLVRVWTTRGKEEQGRFALENSVKLLEYFNEYFGTPYPLPKMDHIAIPDFAAGAMENWGAITYRETALLFDPANSAAAARQRIMEVVAHEMAHMWFGDLVTMEWWDDLWLNESFASWMGDKAVDELFPEWNMWTQFISQDTSAGLSLDGLENSHPIEAKVKDPAEIRELFDAISYSKGGATLRMLEEFLGAEDFRKGLRAYINAHAYGNAQGKDLWQALEAASGKPVIAIMDSWIKQTGYPILTVDAHRSGDDVRLSLSQRRFLYSNILGAGADDSTLWQVPVQVGRKGQQEPTSILMETQATEITLGGGGAADGWVKVNSGQTGFYRVNYSEEEWARLQRAVAERSLRATDRLGLQNDAYALMRAGFAPASVFLDLAKAYIDEDDATVWSDLSMGLKGFEALIADQPYLSQFEAFAGGLYERIVRKMGWDAKPGEGHLDSLLRGTVLSQKGGYGDEALISEAKARFAAFLDDPGSLHPDLRGPVLSMVAQEGNRDAYETFWELERKAELHEEKMRFLGALTRFRDPALLQETLIRSLMPERVRSQDTVLIVASLAANRLGRDLAWEFLKENWAEFDRRYGKGGFAITRIVAVAGAFTTQERHDDVRRFFESHPAPSAARTIKQSLERIQLNIHWLERNAKELANWFQA